MNIYSLIPGTGQDARESFDLKSMIPIEREVALGSSIFVWGVVIIAFLSLAWIVFASKRYDASKSSDEMSGITILSIFLLALTFIMGLFMWGMSTTAPHDNPTKTSSFSKLINLNQTYSDLDSEFNSWANERYGLDIKSGQARNLITVEGKGYNGLTKQVMVEGKLIRAWRDNDRITILKEEDETTEFDLAENIPAKK